MNQKRFLGQLTSERIYRTDESRQDRFPLNSPRSCCFMKILAMVVFSSLLGLVVEGLQEDAVEFSQTPTLVFE